MKAALFDFGGTIDTNGIHWSEMFWKYYQQHHLRVEKKKFEAAFVKGEELLQKDGDLRSTNFRRLLQRQFDCQFSLLGIPISDSTRETIAAECYQEVVDTISRTKPLLEAYAGRLSLGLVSNFYGNLEIVCKEFAIEKFFHAMVDSAIVGVKKPDPAIFSIALSRLGVTPGETYVVGDSYDRDIVPSKQMGCTTIWLKGQSWTSPPSTEAADYIITSFEASRSILLP